MKETLQDWKFWLVASLTLGLAPFSPEPHVWGKLKWIIGGAEGMTLVDWADFLTHGFPWILLGRAIILTILKK